MVPSYFVTLQQALLDPSSQNSYTSSYLQHSTCSHTLVLMLPDSVHFVWSNMNKHINQWTKSCLQCQQTKVTRHTNVPVLSFKPPDDCFDAVHINLVGPLPPIQGYKYLLTCVDRFTRWPKAFPIKDISTELPHEH